MSAKHTGSEGWQLSADVAKALADTGRFAGVLTHCNARFEIYRFPDRSDLRDKELAAIHKTLLQETSGVAYTPWDKQLSRLE